MELLSDPLLIALIAVALTFDFMNGMNDAANSIATIVATRVLAPRFAVAWAAFFNFVAFMVFGLHVAKTVGSGIISPDIINDSVIFGALAGAISWNILTATFGIPSSSSHALIGGLIGSGVASVGGFGAVVWKGVLKTAGGIVWSPVIGIFVALLLVLIVSWLSVRSTPSRADGLFRRLQLVSASLLSLGHGGNDAQKTMGVIAALLFAHGMTKGAGEIPFWVVIACQAAIALGTLFGGWRIVRTMGSRITRLTPMQGVCAETAGATMLFLATSLGIPVSTTHTITGAIIGVGTARRASAVRWGVARRVVIAWLITIPAAGTMGAIFYEVSRLFH